MDKGGMRSRIRPRTYGSVGGRRSFDLLRPDHVNIKSDLLRKKFGALRLPPDAHAKENGRIMNHTMLRSNKNA